MKYWGIFLYKRDLCLCHFERKDKKKGLLRVLDYNPKIIR